MAPDGVHVHLPDQSGILEVHRFGGGPAAFGMEAVPVHALENDFHAVHVKSVPGTEFYRPEADALLYRMKDLAAGVQKRYFQVIQVGMLAFPGVDTGPFHLLLFARRQGSLSERTTFPVLQDIPESGVCRRIFRFHHGPERPVGAGVQGELADMGLGQGAEPYRAVNAAEEPPIRPPLRVVNAVVVGVLFHEDFQPIGSAEADEVGNPVAETVKGAPVHFTGNLAIDLHEGVRHDAVEHDVHLPAFPGGRNFETLSVQACFLTGLGVAVGHVIPSVRVLSEALEFPLGRYFDFGPAPAVCAP